MQYYLKFLKEILFFFIYCFPLISTANKKFPSMQPGSLSTTISIEPNYSRPTTTTRKNKNNNDMFKKENSERHGLLERLKRHDEDRGGESILQLPSDIRHISDAVLVLSLYISTGKNDDELSCNGQA